MSFYWQVILSYDYLLELSYLVDSGISQIQVIKDKLQLLCQREGLVEFQDNNIASLLERSSIAINALLITGHDLNHVICLACGVCPKTALSDGNSKVLSLITLVKFMPHAMQNAEYLSFLQFARQGLQVIANIQFIKNL